MGGVGWGRGLVEMLGAAVKLPLSVLSSPRLNPCPTSAPAWALAPNLGIKSCSLEVKGVWHGGVSTHLGSLGGEWELAMSMQKMGWDTWVHSWWL